MFRRNKPPPAGEPTPPLGRVRPDESVLDELSRAFGVSADDTGDAPEENEDDETSRADPDPLAAATEISIVPSDAEPDGPAADVSDDDAPAADESSASAGAPPKRRTIRIGGDEVTAGFVDAVSLDEALGGSIGGPDTSTPRDGTPGPLDGTPGPHDGLRDTIAIGAHDDLPDAVYLDDELRDDSGGAGTVFIDDDGTGDAIAPKEATSPGIEPRIRQRRIGVRRAASRKRLKWAALVVVVLLILLGVLTVLGSGLFAIDKVSVGGNVYTDRERLDAVIDDLVGTPVLLADTTQAELDLEAIPWVEDARVRAQLPNRATIEIRERTPVLTMRGADGLFRVLDADGRVLDVIEGQPVAFILVAGPGTLDLAAGEFAPVGPASAASLVTKLTPTIRPLVESFEVTADGADLVINLAPPPDREQTSTIRVRFGSAIGDSDQIEKLVRLQRKLDDLPDGVISEINVATEEVTVS